MFTVKFANGRTIKTTRLVTAYEHAQWAADTYGSAAEIHDDRFGCLLDTVNPAGEW